MKKAETLSTFSLEGRFVGFVSDVEDKPKRICVATSQGERYIKLSKELRYYLRGMLQPGDWVEISGIQKYKYKTGELKLKAHEVKRTAPTPQQNVPQAPVAAPKTKACVMVCQKSTCQKRGANQLGQAIEESLRDRGLEDQVAIKGTGCMKECKRGPCVVFMPDKSRYVGVGPQDVPKLIDKHFAAKLIPEGSESELAPVI